MPKEISDVRDNLAHLVEDHAILYELVGINMLPFVERTTSSCSGYVDFFGLITKTPYITILYKEITPEASDFHRKLLSIEVPIEGRPYKTRSLKAGEEYFLAFPFGTHPEGLLIGQEALEIPPEKPEVSYQFFVPQSYNFEDPKNRSVQILEDFWNSVSSLLASEDKTGVYKERRFSHTRSENGIIESPFRKDEQIFI